MLPTLAQLANLRFGVHAKALEEGPMALVQSSAIGEHGIIVHDHIRRITPEVVSFKEEDELREGDVLFIGKGSQHHAAVWPGSDEGTLASSMLYVIRPFPDLLPAFLAGYLNSTVAQAHFTTFRKTGTVNVVGRKALESLPMPLPTLAQQHKAIQLADAAQRTQFLLNELSHAQQQLLNSVWAQFCRP
jgi:hypothetical protein